jgi:hypothetical protein
MHLSQVNEIANHKITEGSEYCWQCYPNARYLNYESDFAYISVIYSTESQTIYEAEVTIKTESWNEVDDKPYRWLNPEFKDIMIAEAKERKVKYRKAWDNIKWIDLEVEEDFLEKAKAIFNGESFDTRIQVPIELDNDTLLKLFTEAHKRDITLNKMVEELLREVIDKHEKDIVMYGYKQDLG